MFILNLYNISIKLNSFFIILVETGVGYLEKNLVHKELKPLFNNIHCPFGNISLRFLIS